MNFPPKTARRLQQEAKALVKKEGIKHTDALELVARSYGFPNWKAVLNAFSQSSILNQPTPVVSNDFIDDEDVSLDEEDLSVVERATDLPHEVKIKVSKNKEHFVSLGVEFSIFEPTITGLRKSILDATRPVRSHFELENFHFFDQQEQGRNHKIIKIAHFVTNDEIVSTKVSLYLSTATQN